jgi:hypothetical protein
MTPKDLPVAWRAEADLLRRYGADPQATTLEAAASKLAAAWQAWLDELVPLAVAAEESGYSEGSLRRMAREAVIPNRAQVEGDYLFRRGDLPRKPGHGVKPPEPPSELVPALPPVPEVAPARPSGLQSRRQVARAVVSGGGR